MGGGIFQLKASGIQDAYIYGEPGNASNFNFLKQIYKRSENFSSQFVELDFLGDVDFSKKIEVIIPRKGDYIHKMYLRLVLPSFVKESGDYSGWTNSVGHAILESAELFVGEQLVDKHNGLFMEIMDEISPKTKSSVKSADGILVGRYDIIGGLEKSADTESYYDIPLKFWFNQNIQSAFPIMSLTYHTMKLVIKLRPFEDLVIFDGMIPPVKKSIVSGSLICEYLFVSDETRNRELVKDHTFLIEQLQCITQSIPAGISETFIDLNFNHPSKDLTFVFISRESLENNDHFNFGVRNTDSSNRTLSILESASLSLDGIERIKENTETFLRQATGLRYRKFVPSKHIYSMVFCDDPEKWYPTGSLNFSMVDNARLNVKLRKGLGFDVEVHVFCRNINLFYIKNGMGGIQFSA
jgi:hypothetical protein